MAQENELKKGTTQTGSADENEIRQGKPGCMASCISGILLYISDFFVIASPFIWRRANFWVFIISLVGGILADLVLRVKARQRKFSLMKLAIWTFIIFVIQNILALLLTVGIKYVGK